MRDRSSENPRAEESSAAPYQTALARSWVARRRQLKLAIEQLEADPAAMDSGTMDPAAMDPAAMDSVAMDSGTRWIPGVVRVGLWRLEQRVLAYLISRYGSDSRLVEWQHDRDSARASEELHSCALLLQRSLNRSVPQRDGSARPLAASRIQELVQRIHRVNSLVQSR